MGENQKNMIPDFYIVGAMKSGTTTLHHILSRHPEICMSIPKETFIIDRDDYRVHKHFRAEYPNEWLALDWTQRKEQLNILYADTFKSHTEPQRKGEASTSYLVSPVAPERIHHINPESKIIIMLRDPVERTYSNYWHGVCSGRFFYHFEKQICHEPDTILNKSYYKEQIERYFQFFKKEQLYICLFEDFVQNIQEHVDRICTFLGLGNSIEVSEIKKEHNVTRYPQFLSYHLFLNFLSRLFGRHFTSKSIKPRQDTTSLLSFIDFLKRKNLTRKESYPMHETTRQSLQKIFRQANDGLSELIGIDVNTYWPYMDKSS
jgi:hypothetical protein